jgi:hypothetical protein
MINYNWTIESCEHLVSTGYITVAHWRCTATDGDYSATVYSTASFGEGDPSIPYADVTQAEVLEWVWANGVDKDVTEASLASQIEAQKNPVQESGLPWV